jgi:tRNA modification GTPase
MSVYDVKKLGRDTIAAISTPVGYGGIGIIKICGPKSARIAQKIFVSAKMSEFDESRHEDQQTAFTTHYLNFGRIVAPDSGKVIDEVLLSFMQGPHSYTGEDVVEINSHSGPYLMRKILEMILSFGARMADPGEFTRRAFLNGRIDLTQAEAIADIIHSKCETALEIATGQLQGNLRNGLAKIRGYIQSLWVQVEADIDFSEDIEDDTLKQDPIWDQIFEKAIHPLEKAIEAHAVGQLYREGLKVAVVGKPNVGKSSLLNRLLDKERAIVTKIPGTTRDLIEESLIVNGIPVVVIDTAGLRQTVDEIEKAGIKRTEACIDSADLVLFLVDVSQGVDTEDQDIFNRIGSTSKIIVFNKIDLVKRSDPKDVPGNWQNIPQVKISAKFDLGIEKLKEKMVSDLAFGEQTTGKNSMVPNLRQKEGLKICLAALMRIVSAKEKGMSPEFIALDIREALDVLGEVVGENTKYDVIESIFDTFCIGK